jgi:hypothetical protein
METLSQTKTTDKFWEIRQQTACPLCGGLGFQLLENNGQRAARKCRCISPDRIANLQRRSGIPSTYWRAGLNGIQAHSLQEAALIDALKAFLAKKDLPAILAWVPPSTLFNSTELILDFANDLIRLQGYSCLWLDCEVLSRLPARTNPSNLEHFDPCLAKGGDFLFIQNYQAEPLKAKMQAWLEDVLRHRVLHHKSTIFVGPRPEGISGHQSLFAAADLGISVWKKVKDLDPSKNSSLEPQSGWLF